MYSAAWWRWLGRWCADEFLNGWQMARTGLPDEIVTRNLEARPRTRSRQRTPAVIALVLALAFGAAAVVWSDADVGNVLAELAGVLLSVAVALLLVDVLARRDRRQRYAELSWVATQTALDAIEDLAGRIAHACRRADALSSIDLYFRAGDPGDEPERDTDAQFWRSRTPDEGKYHLERLRDAEAEFDAYADGSRSPARGAGAVLTTLETVAADLERLERVADRLAAPAADSDETLTFVRWLWRAADQRHELRYALTLHKEGGHIDAVWSAAQQAAYLLGNAYETGLAVADDAARATGRATAVGAD